MKPPSNDITIGIDARSLEGNRTGVGRYLSNLLRVWTREDRNMRLRLYFKEAIPADIPSAPWIETVVITSESNALWTHWHLPRALKRDGVDLLFSPWYVAPLWGMDNIPFVITLHDIVFEAHPEWVPPMDRFLLRWVARRSARRAAHIITISEFSQSEIIQHYDIDADTITVTPLGVDPAFTEHPPLPIDGRDPLIVSVGSIFNRRHILDLIAAFQRLDTKARLVIVGADHTYPPQYTDERVADCNASRGERAIRRVDSLPQENLVALMRRAALVVSLSTYEGFNLPPLEAQALGTPVLLADTPVAREVFDDSAMFIAHPFDSNVLASMLDEALHHPSKMQNVIDQGEENVKRFSWRRCADKTYHVLSTVVNSTRV